MPPEGWFVRFVAVWGFEHGALVGDTLEGVECDFEAPASEGVDQVGDA